MKKTRTDLLNGPIYKQIFYFFLPIMLGSFLQQLYNTVDAMVVGNFVGKVALAAVGGSTGTLINLIINFVVGLASGATVVIAQSYGARNQKGVFDGVRSGMFLGLTLGGFLMIFGFIFTPNLLRMLNVPSEVLPYSITYMRIYLTGMIFTMTYNVGSSILRAVGDSKRPLYFLMVSCLTNIVLDLVFVVVFKLGVVGVGVATVMSQLASAILVVYVLSNKEAPYYYNFKSFGFEKDTLKKIIIIGIPMGISSVMYSITNLFIQAQVNTYGTDTVAAYTAYEKIDSLYWMISGAYGAATVTIVGQCFGAGKYDRAKKATLVAILMDGITTVFISLICCLCGRYLYNLFTNDVNVIAIGMRILLFIAPTWITFVLIEILSSSIRACGESIKPMIITGVGVCLLRIIWITCVPKTDVIQTFYCYPLSWTVTSIIFLIYYLKGHWFEKCISKRKTSLETK